MKQKTIKQETLHHYDPNSFVYTKSEPAKRDQFDECWLTPSSSTISPLVEIKDGEEHLINVYSEELKTWSLQPNFIGQKFYKKENGDEVIIDKAGEVSAGLTDKERPESWFIFDEKTNKWVEDESLYSQHIANLKLNKQLENANAAQAYIDAVTQDFAPTFERESYPLQAKEADAWDKDKSANTPILDGIAEARGVNPDLLKAKALEKSQQYQALCAKASGKRQAIEDQINAAKNIIELESIQPTEVFKVDQ